MRNTNFVSKVLFFLFAGLAIVTIVIQIYYSNVRPLTTLESILMSSVALVFSTVSGWYFSRMYGQNANTDEVVEKLIGVLEGSARIGLISIEPQLRNGTTTITAIKDISYGFDFLGIGGSKFVSQIFNERTHIGKFIAKNERPSIRMLLLDPDCELIGVWITDAEKCNKVRQSIRDSLRILAQQIQKGRKIQVRLYNFTPPMRIQIVDKEMAYICEYDPLSDGWDAPQLCFAKKGQKPLLNSLMSLYDYFWENAKEFKHNEYLI
jgi:hypothetical protein